GCGRSAGDPRGAACGLGRPRRLPARRCRGRHDGCSAAGRAAARRDGSAGLAVSAAPGRIGSASWRGSWRVALRLARREIVRGKGRAALVAIMVGVPVLLVVSLATLYHTNEVSPQESLTSRLG